MLQDLSSVAVEASDRCRWLYIIRPGCKLKGERHQTSTSSYLMFVCLFVFVIVFLSLKQFFTELGLACLLDFTGFIDVGSNIFAVNQERRC